MYIVKNKKNKAIGLIAQVILFGMIFIISQFVSDDPSATTIGMLLVFLCGWLFKSAGDYKKK